MNIVELDDQEQRKFDAGHRKKAEGEAQWYCDPITGRMHRVWHEVILGSLIAGFMVG
jgi:hypothetical protein